MSVLTIDDKLADTTSTAEQTTSSGEETSDGELMQGVIQQDEAALEGLFDRYRQTVYAVCLGVLKNESDAEEALVDIFMEVWRRPERFDVARGNLSTYLMMLARSRAIDHLRRRTSRSRATAFTSQHDLDHFGDSRHDPLEACSLAERRVQVHQALATLMPAQREAVRYSFLEGLSHREIADRLDVPLGTVKTRIRLGLMRFRDALRGFDDDAASPRRCARTTASPSDTAA